MSTRTTLSTTQPERPDGRMPTRRQPPSSTPAPSPSAPSPSAVLPASAFTPDEVGEWILDESASSVEFTSAVLGGWMPAHGRFRSLAGAVVVASDGRVSARITVDTTSVATRIPTMTMHLRTAGLLSVKRHPSAEFELDDLVVHGTDAEVTGRLTARGVTREITLNVAGELATPTRLRLEGVVVLHRSEFGLRWNVLKMVPEDVRLNALLVFVKSSSAERLAVDE